jgi:hypothetical protein
MAAGQDAVSQAVQEFKANGESSAFQKQLSTIWSSENKDPQRLSSDLKTIQSQTGLNISNELTKLGFPSVDSVLNSSPSSSPTGQDTVTAAKQSADHEVVGSLGQKLKYDAANQVIEIDYPNNMSVTLTRDGTETVTGAKVQDPNDKDNNVSFVRDDKGEYLVYNDKNQKETKVVTSVTIAPDGSATIKGKLGIFSGTEKVSAAGTIS